MKIKRFYTVPQFKISFLSLKGTCFQISIIVNVSRMFKKKLGNHKFLNFFVSKMKTNETIFVVQSEKLLSSIKTQNKLWIVSNGAFVTEKEQKSIKNRLGFFVLSVFFLVIAFHLPFPTLYYGAAIICMSFYLT